MVSYRLYTPDNAVGTKFDGEIYFLFDLLFNQINFRLEHAVTRCHGLTKLNSSVLGACRLLGARFAPAVLDSSVARGSRRARMPGMRLIRERERVGAKADGGEGGDRCVRWRRLG